MKKRQLLASFLLPFLLSGCDSVKHALGLRAYQPDEGNVQKNPPLVQPPLGEPEFIKLRPPRTGEKGAGHVTAKGKAQEVIGVKEEKGSTPSLSVSEQEILAEIKKDQK